MDTNESGEHWTEIELNDLGPKNSEEEKEKKNGNAKDTANVEASSEDDQEKTMKLRPRKPLYILFVVCIVAACIIIIVVPSAYAGTNRSGNPKDIQSTTTETPHQHNTAISTQMIPDTITTTDVQTMTTTISESELSRSISTTGDGALSTDPAKSTDSVATWMFTKTDIVTVETFEDQTETGTIPSMSTPG